MEKRFNFIPVLIFAFFILSDIFGFQFIVFALILFGAYYLAKNSGRLSFDITNLFSNKKSMGNVYSPESAASWRSAKRWLIASMALIFGLWLLFSSLIMVDAGQVGVYSLFGKVSDRRLSSGLHLVNPLGRVDQMSVRTEEYTMSEVSGEGKVMGSDSIQALTKEGLNVSLDITVLYRLDEAKATEVYRTVGLGYEDKIVRPEIRSTIREIVSQFTAKEMYSEKREEANSEISRRLGDALSKRGLVVESVLLRNVRLPDNLAKSIQEKLQAEQEAQKYDFLLDREKKEKQRKVIEAEGQRDSQRIVNESLSPNYLYYLYINQLKDRQGTIYVPTSPTTGMPVFKDISK